MNSNNQYFGVKLLDWIDNSKLYMDVVATNPNKATLQFLISISEFDKTQIYYNWCGVLMPWDHEIWRAISVNPDAIDILEKYPNRIDWINFCRNTSPRAIKRLRENLDKIDWPVFSQNSSPEAVKLMMEHPHKICWQGFSLNTSPLAIEFLSEHPDKIVWSYLVSNTSPEALNLIKIHKPRNKTVADDWIHWIGFLRNPAALSILKTKIDVLKNHDESMRYVLYQNPNPDIFQLIKEIPDEEILWEYLALFHPKIYRTYKTSTHDTDYIISHLHCMSMEPDIIDLIETNQDRMYWEDFSKNPAIFEYVYDYNKIKNDRRELNEEIIAKFWHPTRVSAWVEAEIEMDDF